MHDSNVTMEGKYLCVVAQERNEGIKSCQTNAR